MGTGTCAAGEERALRPRRAEELGELSAGRGSPCAGEGGKGQRFPDVSRPGPHREQRVGVSPARLLERAESGADVSTLLGRKEESVPCKDYIKVQFQCSQVKSYGPGRSPASSVTGPTAQGRTEWLWQKSPDCCPVLTETAAKPSQDLSARVSGQFITTPSSAQT